MEVRVSPTRMELLRLKRRIELAERGHDLLEEKLEGLVKEFMPLIDEYVELRDELDQKVPRALSSFSRIAAEKGDESLKAALGQTGFTASVEIWEERLANVPVPRFRARTERALPHYSLLSTPPALDGAVNELVELFALMLKTCETEEAVRKLAKEIERTRRRVNALEYIFIPRLHEARKFIQYKLDEDERAAHIRSMKVKELLEKAEARG